MKTRVGFRGGYEEEGEGQSLSVVLVVVAVVDLSERARRRLTMRFGDGLPDLLRRDMRPYFVGGVCVEGLFLLSLSTVAVLLLLSLLLSTVLLPLSPPPALAANPLYS